MNTLICQKCLLENNIPSVDGKLCCFKSGLNILDAIKYRCPIGKHLGVYCERCGGLHLIVDCPIPPDYEPTPTNATEGGCGCKK